MLRLWRNSSLSLSRHRVLFFRPMGQLPILENAPICDGDGNAGRNVLTLQQIPGRCVQLELELEQFSPLPDASTYAALLRKCSNAKALGVGQRVHAHILENRRDLGILVDNMLVEMYGKCGSVDGARAVFDNMPNRNAFSWNIMIAAYAQNGHHREALESFSIMNLEGVRPDRVTCIAVLDACGSLGHLAQGKCIHGIVFGSGYESDVVVGTAVVTMYNKCRSIGNARSMFDKMPMKNVVSWTAMIATYAQSGHGREALQLFLQMEHEGVAPNEITFVSILDACASLEALRHGRMIHERILAGGFDSDVILGNTLVHMYGKCGQVHDARSVFDKMVRKNAVTWNAMIAACSRHGHHEEALNLFGKMDLEGLKPNKITFISIIDACASMEALAEGKLIHESIAAGGLDSDHVLGNALVNMYGKCGSLKAARWVLEGIQGKDKVSWTTMLAAYAQHGHGGEAFDLFKRMDLEGIKPDKFTFVNLIDSCISVSTSAQCMENEAEVSSEALALGEEIHGRLVGSGIELDVVLQTALVNMYGRCGNPDMARKTFDSMSVKDVPVWNAMFAAYALREQGKEALILFHRMDLEGIRPDKVTFLSIFEACSSLAAVELGRRIHARICECGLESDTVLVTALVNLYGKSGSLVDAKNVFDRAHQGDVVTWSAMIAAYAQYGHGEEALRCFYQMQQGGVRPDSITFVSVVSGCSHSGLMDQALQSFTSLRADYGIIPTSEHYGCLIDLLGRAGWLDAAERVIKRMPVPAHLSTWMTLLSACRTHSDVMRARRVAKRISRLNPSVGAPYALLANIFSLSRKWDDVRNVRQSMLERGFVKQPGCSWIEIKDKVHEFFVGDESHHPREDEIYAELERLYIEIRKAGYERDPLRKVHDLGEQEKKFMLCYHSEKLAVAFGLISTPSGTPLRVVKNLGICNDCHAAIKFISKVVQREVTVRDSSRFHHFKHGSCSCGDQIG